MNKFSYVIILLLFVSLFVGCSNNGSLDELNGDIKQKIKNKEMDDLYFKLSDGIYTLISENFPNNFNGYEFQDELILLTDDRINIEMRYKNIDSSETYNVRYLKYLDISDLDNFNFVKDGAYFKLYKDGYILIGDCGDKVYWFTNNTFDIIDIEGNDVVNSPVFENLFNEFPLEKNTMNNLKLKFEGILFSNETDCVTVEEKRLMIRNSN